MKEIKAESSSKSKPSYSINVLPPTEDKQKSTDIDANPLKRKPPGELINNQLKRGKPEEESKISDSKGLSRGDTIELEEAIQRSLMDVEEDSRSNISYRSRDSENANSNGNRAAIYNRTRKTEDFKGEYLEMTDNRGKVKTYKIQVLDKFAKIEVGDGYSRTPDVTYSQYFDAKDAISDAQKAITEKIAEGYRKVPEKFVFAFDISEATRGREELINSLNPRGNKSPVGSRSNSPSRLGAGRDDYSNASRRSSLVQSDRDDDDLDLSAFADDSKDVPKRKEDLLKEPNKDHSLGKPISQPYASVLLAHKWEDGGDPTGYYMSEKLDGVRCLWTGTQMYSRNNKRYYPPPFFTKDFPGSPLDGELWIGRSTFQKCVSVVRKQTPVENEWRLVQYLVFDAPGLNLPFKERYKKLEEFFAKIDSPYIKLHKHVICTSPEQLLNEHERVEKLGGEGMMLRDPNSFYEHRRSKTLLKVKKFDDDEAVVIGHEPGTGRCTGMLGAIRVRNSQGVEFSIGSGFNDAQRRRPPKIGSKVTYKYQGVSTSNTPRFPIFLREFGGH